jgi:hypothetical protein
LNGVDVSEPTWANALSTTPRDAERHANAVRKGETVFGINEFLSVGR